MKVTILGCGSSAGSPLFGQPKPSNQKNWRTRASIFIEGENTKLLIDTSPDLRAQALTNNILKVDAVLYTHEHADHTHGIDDIKSFNYQKQGPINAYSDEVTIQALLAKFAYCFKPPKPEYGWFRPCIIPNIIKPYEPFKVGEFEITAFIQNHGSIHSLGFRIGNFAYSTDVKSFPTESEKYLEGLDVWVVDALREEVAPTHSHLQGTLDWVAKYKPKNAFLTHMNAYMDYDELVKDLPRTVMPSYDGLVIDV